jgi:DNA-binding GntR family transcriptional regulator
MPVDYDADVPPYLQVAAELRARIASGELAPRSRIPSIDALTQEYGIARMTARKVRRVLLDEGLVRNVAGWGTYVVDQAAAGS